MSGFVLICRSALMGPQKELNFQNPLKRADTLKAKVGDDWTCKTEWM